MIHNEVILKLVVMGHVTTRYKVMVWCVVTRLVTHVAHRNKECHGCTFNWPGANDKDDDSDISFSHPGLEPMRLSVILSCSYTIEYEVQYYPLTSKSLYLLSNNHDLSYLLYIIDILAKYSYLLFNLLMISN